MAGLSAMHLPIIGTMAGGAIGAIASGSRENSNAGDVIGGALLGAGIGFGAGRFAQNRIYNHIGSMVKNNKTFIKDSFLHNSYKDLQNLEKNIVNGKKLSMAEKFTTFGSGYNKAEDGQIGFRGYSASGAYKEGYEKNIAQEISKTKTLDNDGLIDGAGI